jgi:Zn-dependent peptidase ImmA (M78 family)
MAHELGHIALHSGVLSTIESTNGSNELKGKFEEEANRFAEELLRLRDERNKALFLDK